MILGSAQTQPARDRRQGSNEQETHHVAEKGPLLIAGTGILQPLQEGREKGHQSVARRALAKQDCYAEELSHALCSPHIPRSTHLTHANREHRVRF